MANYTDSLLNQLTSPTMTDDALYNFGRYYDTTQLAPGSPGTFQPTNIGTFPQTNSSSLFGDLFSGENFGSTLGGIGGIGSMLLGGYFANESLKDTKRNNSLYRDITSKQSDERTKAINSWS